VSRLSEVRDVIKIVSTWQKRIIDAAVEVAPHAVKPSIRRTARVIGGRVTTKTDLVVDLVGDEDGHVAALVEQIFGDLNERAAQFVADLPERDPAKRKLARRSWLEREAAVVARKLTGGSYGQHR
jgi:FAD/FMN-containing dehydrogenase